MIFPLYRVANQPSELTSARSLPCAQAASQSNQNDTQNGGDLTVDRVSLCVLMRALPRNTCKTRNQQ